jgi:hypothetical protein
MVREIDNPMRKISLAIACLLLFLSTGSAQERPKRIVSGKGVYLFGPSLAEADSVPADESEALSDFANYSSQIAVFARANGIYCGYISARKIEIHYGSMKILTVYRDTVEFGTIFTDGRKHPIMVPYVATDDILKEKAKEFFELK